jgi:hypothetical protein
MHVTIECPLCTLAGRKTILTVEVGSEQHWSGHRPNCGPVGGVLFAVRKPLKETEASYGYDPTQAGA